MANAYSWKHPVTPSVEQLGKYWTHTAVVSGCLHLHPLSQAASQTLWFPGTEMFSLCFLGS